MSRVWVLARPTTTPSSPATSRRWLSDNRSVQNGHLSIRPSPAPDSSVAWSETEAEGAVSSLPVSVSPKDTVMARHAFSQALLRLTSLSALKMLLEDHLSSVASLPHSLEMQESGLGRRKLIEKLSGLMKFRQGLTLSLENFSDAHNTVA